jgi:HEAT repeat protein
MMMGTRNNVLFVLLFLTAAGCRQIPLDSPLTPVSHDSLNRQIHQTLIQTAGSTDPVVRCHVMEICGSWDSSQAVDFLQTGLNDPVPAVRFAAAVACGDRQATALKKKLQNFLDDPDPAVRLAGAYALEKLGDKRFQNAYDKALFGDNPQLAGQACMLLGKLGPTPLRSESKTKLWAVLHNQACPVAVRLQAAESLARLKDSSVLKKLLIYAGSGYADDRMIAISGLEQLGGNDANAMLITLVDDQQIEVQLAAIASLGRLAEPKDCQLARKNLQLQDSGQADDSSRRIRGLAALALGKIGTSADASLLYRTMRDQNVYVRLAAARGAIYWLSRNANP